MIKLKESVKDIGVAMGITKANSMHNNYYKETAQLGLSKLERIGEKLLLKQS